MALPFRSPPNERSFSSLIDDAILATGKPGSLIAAVSAANLTIRECQAFGLFARDLIEENFVTDASPYIFTRPSYFRKLRTAKYASSGDYPKFLLPGKIQKNETSYFYAADSYYVFKGMAVGETLDLANYYWAKPLIYYGLLGTTTVQYPGGPYTTRPAYFDILEDEWMYLNADGDAYATTTGDADEDALRVVNATNWLVTDWRDMILSGIKAKVWNAASDPRGTVEFSAYKQTQNMFRIAMGLEAEGF